MIIASRSGSGRKAQGTSGRAYQEVTARRYRRHSRGSPSRRHGSGRYRTGKEAEKGRVEVGLGRDGRIRVRGGRWFANRGNAGQRGRRAQHRWRDRRGVVVIVGKVW